MRLFAPPVNIETDPSLPVLSDRAAVLREQRALLDVRAPVEFAQGALPGAINLPLMTDEERHRVGIRYREAGQAGAIALGAKLVGPDERRKRTARWIEFAEAYPTGALYCFRGGLRSRIAQQWLAEAGVRYPRLDGGFKAMRRHLIESLDQSLASLSLRVIGGRTGVGKTLLLADLPRAVDLEGLAHHRGSSFGRRLTPQPSNIDFEHAVTMALARLVPCGHPVHVEDEAKLIGRVYLPEALRDAMATAPAIILEAPMSVRVANAVDDYVTGLFDEYAERTLDADPFDRFAAHHRASLDRVRKRLGGVRWREASGLLEDALDRHRRADDVCAYEPFIAYMLEHYYDPMYDYQLARKQRRVVFRGPAEAVLAWIDRQDRQDRQAG